MAIGERNLLFGLLAVQLQLATSQDLVSAAAVWAVDQQRSLGDILVERGLLSERQQRLILELIDEQVRGQGGDMARVLESLGAPKAPGTTAPKSGSGSGEFPSSGGSSALPLEQQGRYTMRSELGHGGIGRVMIAFDEAIRREIALKELLHSGSASGSGAGQDHSPHKHSAARSTRFLREARITGQLEHPGIVPVYELGRRADDSVYYTMKLVRGTTLADKLRACRTMGDRLALLPHFLDLCHAIGYAHSRGVIHRDIKPANIMVGEFGETVLLDWGLARVRGQADDGAEKLADEVRLLKEAGAGESVDGKPIGTPSYMPPEQADGRIAEVDERSDVWSLGAVLYELLTGRPPFSGSSAFEVIGMVLSEDTQPVLERATDAPPELAAVAMRCLQREPRARYQSVEQLTADVSAFQTGGLVRAYSYSTGLMLRRWASRHWVELAIAGVALLLLIITGAVGYSQVLRRNSALTQVNAQLDMNKRELLAFKLGTESNQQFVRGHGEQATLLALEAARYLEGSNAWMPTVEKAIRSCAAADPFSRELIGHEGAVRRLAISTDGHWLASSSDDKNLRLWDLTDEGRTQLTFGPHPASVSAAAFTADGRHVISACHDGNLRMWDILQPGNQPVLFSGHKDAIWCVACSPDGRYIASGAVDSSVRLWDPHNPGVPARVAGFCDAAVQWVLFSPDGSQLLSTSEDTKVRIWQLENLAAPPRVLVNAGGSSTFATFSPDGSILAVSCQGPALRLWNTADWDAAPAELHGHDAAVWGLAFSADGRTLASASSDLTIRLWDMEQRAHAPRILRVEDELWSVAFSPDGRQLISSGKGKAILLWDLTRGKVSPRMLRGHEALVRALDISSDGNLLISGSKDTTIKLWDRSRADSEPRTLSGHTDLVSGVALSPDEKLLASSSWDRTVRLWDLTRLEDPPTIVGTHDDRVRSVAFSPDGSLLAAGGDDGAMRIYDFRNPRALPQVLRFGEDDFYMCVAFSPDGNILACASSDSTVHLWDLRQPRQAPATLHGHNEAVLTVAFSHDGRLLATGSVDQTARVWDLGSEKQEQRVLRGHRADVYGVDFSPSGELLVTASWDGTARLWNLNSPGQEGSLLEGHSGSVATAIFSPDGEEVFTGSSDQAIGVWRSDALDLIPVIAELPRRNLTLDEWMLFVGADVPYRRTVEHLPPGSSQPGVLR
jgi:WD40 repeat protein/serine/threonine protein kinase